MSLVLLSIYTALAIIVSTPIITNALLTFPSEQMQTYRLGVFIGLFAILYILFSHNMSLRSEAGHHWWQGAILSFMQVGLLMSCILTLMPSDKIVSAVAVSYFTGDIARSFWLLAPILSLFIMRPSRRHSSPPLQPPY